MPGKFPQHIAIIMDGNGRWAVEHGLDRSEGHRRGAQTIEKIVEACHDRKIKYLTIYAFSEENWQRPTDEVKSLMKLLRYFILNKRQEMLNKGIRFLTIGETERLDKEVYEELLETIRVTRDCQQMTFIVALSYGSRQEICRAVTNLVKNGAKKIEPADLETELYTHGIPDPDLLIRTSGEYRISNFLLWQLAYTELYFTEMLWPDFDEKALDRAIESFVKRERRFGMTSEQISGGGR